MLAARAGAKLLLVHGIDERGEFPAHYWPGLRAADLSRLKEEADRLRANGVALEERLLGAAPDDGVARCAEEAGAGVIVVASSGMGAMGRLLIGSISERIAETARVPTLVVRDPAVLIAWLRGQYPLKVFVAADFTPTSDAALHWAEGLTQIAPCQITVGFIDREAHERGEQTLHLPVGGPPPASIQKMIEEDLHEKARALYGRHEIHVQVLPAADRVDLRLLALARDSSAELIVVGTHQWHGLSRLRHSSVSRRILHEAKTNVACVPARPLSNGPEEVALTRKP